MTMHQQTTIGACLERRLYAVILTFCILSTQVFENEGRSLLESVDDNHLANYTDNNNLKKSILSLPNLSRTGSDGGETSAMKFDPEETDSSAEHALYQMLLGGDRYQKHVRPVRNHKKPITVRVGMCVMMIEELVERDQIMVMAACVKMVWVDEFLAWNPADYDNLTWMAVSSTSLWLPDIAIINSPEPYSLTRKITNVDLNYKGEIGYFPSGRLATRCNLQITYFPFDWQHCEVRFESWIYPSQFLEIELYPGDAVDLKEYYVNHQWTVTGYRILSEKADYDGKNFSSITFTFTLKRKSSFYFMYFIFPELLLALLQTLSHTLPVEHPGRMTMLTALFIGTSVTHAGIASHIPKSSDTMSLLQIYMAIMSINLVFALIVTFVMLYTVLRYPNEEPCARAMMAAFFSIVWPTRPRPSQRRRSSQYPPIDRTTDRFQQEQQQLLLLQQKLQEKQTPSFDDGLDGQHDGLPTSAFPSTRRQHPPAPTSIYEAILASQQASKTADKLAYFDDGTRPVGGTSPTSPSLLQRELSGGFAVRSVQSSGIHLSDLQGYRVNSSPNCKHIQQRAGQSSPQSSSQLGKKRQVRRSNDNSKVSSPQAHHDLVSLSDPNANSNTSDNAIIVSMKERSIQSTIVRNRQRTDSEQQKEQLEDGIQRTSSFVCSMSVGSGEQEQSQSRDGDDGNSTPGAMSLAVGGATTYYASQQRCIANSPTSVTSPSQRSHTQSYRGGMSNGGDRSGGGAANDEMMDTNVIVTPGTGVITTATRPIGVAFQLDDEQQAQVMRRRGTVAAVMTNNLKNSNSGSGSGITGGSTRGARGSSSGGSDDHDLKRRWLLYCVALDKSIMYANGIWNLTLPLALFWIVPALHEAMLSPQLDR